MPPPHHRTPGPVSAALAVDGRGEGILQMVADSVLLAPATLAMLFNLVGAQGIALFSDAMAASGMPDGS